jgi:LacI family transcriptional regulator
LNATILEQARLRNYEIVTGYLEKNIDLVLNSFLNMHLDGIIMEIRDWTENAERIAKIAGRPGAKPIVLRRRVAKDYPLDAIYPDFEGATRTATKYLIGLGHRNIMYLGTADEERGRTFMKTARENRSGKVKAACASSEPTPLAAYQAALSVLSSKPRPTGLIVMNDYSAQGALRAAGELKIRIPDELSVIGYDDIELSSFGYIPLTTMHHPIDKLGSRLLEMLLARIEGDKSPPKHEMMEFSLIERSSSGPLKK